MASKKTIKINTYVITRLIVCTRRHKWHKKNHQETIFRKIFRSAQPQNWSTQCSLVTITVGFNLCRSDIFIFDGKSSVFQSISIWFCTDAWSGAYITGNDKWSAHIISYNHRNVYLMQWQKSHRLHIERSFFLTFHLWFFFFLSIVATQIVVIIGNSVSWMKNLPVHKVHKQYSLNDS